MQFLRDRKKIAGSLLLVGGAQFIILTILAEAVYPNFSVSNNYISDLGIWNSPSAAIFNFAIILHGLLTLASAYLFHEEFKTLAVSIPFALIGLGAIVAGVFPFDSFVVNGFPVIHNTGAIMAFISGGVAAITVYKITKAPFRYISVVFGGVALLALTLFMFTSPYNYLGLGVGGMESMIFYPELIWVIGFGGYLMALSDKV